jgi:DNA-binding NarL/FixJ family response regulator
MQLGLIYESFPKNTSKRKVKDPAPPPLPVADLRKTILIVEDQAAIREMITEVLRTYDNFKIIGTAAEGQTAIQLALQLKPDVLLLDVLMPGLSGIEVLRRLSKSIPKMRVVVFSAKQEPQIIRGLIQEGMHGFVNKNSSLSELRQALDKVAQGENWYNETFGQTVREALAKSNSHADSMIELLTPREREITVLIARSHSSKEIARLLDISLKTSENHRANLMRKLGVHDVAGLVRFAVRHGLVDPSVDP